MIRYSTYDDGLAAQMIKNAAKIPVQLFSEPLVSEEWSSLFCRENGVNKDFGQGLRH
jgi:hypothetical protein